MPIACVFTDPIVFQHGIDSPPDAGWFASLPSWAMLMYALIGWQMFNLVTSWFLSEFEGFRAWFAGTFLIGTVLAFGVGIAILPLTLLGLFVLFGVLGFTPLITGYVYLRACIRNWPTAFLASKSRSVELRWLYFTVGIATALLVPVVVIAVVSAQR